MKIFYYLTCSNEFQDWYRLGYYDGVKSHIMKFLVVSLSLFLIVLVTSIIISILEKIKKKKKKTKIIERSDKK